MTHHFKASKDTLSDYYITQQLKIPSLNTASIVCCMTSNQLVLKIDISTPMPGSIYTYSSLQLLRYSGTMYLLSPSVLTATNIRSTYVVFTVQLTALHKNAYTLANDLCQHLQNGLNMTYVTTLLSSKIKYVSLNSTAQGLGLMISGQLKGYTQGRSIQEMSMICLGDSTSRCLDVGSHTFITIVGLVGIKTALWI